MGAVPGGGMTLSVCEGSRTQQNSAPGVRTGWREEGKWAMDEDASVSESSSEILLGLVCKPWTPISITGRDKPQPHQIFVQLFLWARALSISHLLTHSSIRTHSLTHSFIYSLIHSFSHSCFSFLSIIMHPWGRPVVRQTQAHEFKMGSCLVAVHRRSAPTPLHPALLCVPWKRWAELSGGSSFMGS